MKSIATFAAAATLAMTAFATQAANIESPLGDHNWPSEVQSESTRTRAEVHTELLDAVKNNRMAMADGDHVRLRADETSRHSTLTREEVRAGAIAAMKDGSIVQGER